MIRFFVPGDPTPKGRPRATATIKEEIKMTRYGPIIARRARPRLYMPSATIEGEERVRAAFMEKYHVDPATGPLRLEMTAYFKPPKNLRAAIARGEIYAERIPDGDNLLKLVMDALEGVVYYNDKQIVSWHGKKVYGMPEGVLIIIDRINVIGGCA